jgi:hypothetical protein
MERTIYLLTTLKGTDMPETGITMTAVCMVNARLSLLEAAALHQDSHMYGPRNIRDHSHQEDVPLRIALIQSTKEAQQRIIMDPSERPPSPANNIRALAAATVRVDSLAMLVILSSLLEATITVPAPYDAEVTSNQLWTNSKIAHRAK